MLDAVLQRRLVFITGKGGVGQTAAAVALALAAARAGKRTLVVEVNPFGRLGEYLGDLTLGADADRDHARARRRRRSRRRVIMEDFLAGMLRIARPRAPSAREQHVPGRDRRARPGSRTSSRWCASPSGRTSASASSAVAIASTS